MATVFESNPAPAAEHQHPHEGAHGEYHNLKRHWIKLPDTGDKRAIDRTNTQMDAAAGARECAGR
jgi:hypothetical protein